MAAPFNGLSLYVRQSFAPENENCLAAATAGCLVSRSGENLFLQYSSTQQQEIPSDSRIAKQLQYCEYSTCSLLENDCATPLASARISLQQTPLKLFSELTNSVTEWRETFCLKCNHPNSGAVVTIDSITLVKLMVVG